MSSGPRWLEHAVHHMLCQRDCVVQAAQASVTQEAVPCVLTIEHSLSVLEKRRRVGGWEEFVSQRP